MFNLYQFRLPFKKPFKTAVGTFSYRHGVILRYQKDETDLISEASPLPGFSSESLEDVIDNLASHGATIDTFFSGDFNTEELSRFLQSLPQLPSLQFAVSSLGLYLLAERKNVSFSRLFKRDPAPEWIQKNAVIGDVDSESFLEQANRYIESGFTVLKCKVTADTGHLPESLQKIATAFPNVCFRLDANQSWSAGQVRRLSKRFKDLPIQYIEEPAQSSSIREFNEIATQCMLPVAADESVVRFGLQPWMASDSERPYLIIKPMLLGNIIDLSETIGRKGDYRDRVIFTSTLESAVGRKIIALFAGLFGSKKDAHGLHTGHLFRNDLLTADDPVQNNSKMAINHTESINFYEIDQNVLQQVRLG